MRPTGKQATPIHDVHKCIKCGYQSVWIAKPLDYGLKNDLHRMQDGKLCFASCRSDPRVQMLTSDDPATDSGVQLRAMRFQQKLDKQFTEDPF